MKYISHGILFKFCVDIHSLYGGDGFASKAAGRFTLFLSFFFFFLFILQCDLNPLLHLRPRIKRAKCLHTTRIASIHPSFLHSRLFRSDMTAILTGVTVKGE